MCKRVSHLQGKSDALKTKVYGKFGKLILQACAAAAAAAATAAAAAAAVDRASCRHSAHNVLHCAAT